MSREAQRAVEMGLLADAERCCLYVLARDGTQSESLRCLADIVARREEWHKVVHCATLLERAGHLDAADEVFDLAHDTAPGEVEPLVRRGLLFQRRGRGSQALDCFRRALALDPVLATAHVQSGLIHLSMRLFRLGWTEFEWRLRLPQYQALRAAPKPLWHGESLDQRGILIQAEPRLEDTIVFKKYVLLLADRGARITVSGPPEVRSVFEGERGIECVIDEREAADPAVLQTIGWRCAIGSLPLWLGPEADSIPLELTPERLLSEW